MDFARTIEELENAIGGIQALTRLPDLVFMVDLKRDKTAYKEAVKKHLPIVAVCDTNVNPTDVDYMIPANDDAVKSIDMISGLVAQAILEGKKLALTNKAAMTAAKEAKEKEEAEFAAKAAAETATTEPAAE